MRILVMGVALLALMDGGGAQENYESWRLHTPTFPSTGGGGVMIGEYKPVIVGDKCTTDFTATLPDGKVYYNSVEFDAVPAQGGTQTGPRPIGSFSKMGSCAALHRPPDGRKSAAAPAQVRRIRAASE
jgi:hypothetical protein